MYEVMRDWLSEHLKGYEIAGGGFVDTPDLNDTKFAVLISSGGDQSADVRYSKYRVLLLGRRDKREDSIVVMGSANNLILLTIDNGTLPRKGGNIESVSDIIGPSFTLENRAWCELNFEVLY